MSSSPTKTYPQQHEPWRPDWPPVWHHFHDGKVYDREPVWVGKSEVAERDRNIQAHAKTVWAIAGVMQS